MPDASAAKALPLLRKRSCGMDENCAHFDANKTNKLLRIIPPPVAMKNLPSCRDTLPLAVKALSSSQAHAQEIYQKTQGAFGSEEPDQEIEQPKIQAGIGCPYEKKFQQLPFACQT